jgi:outer membrane protein OmpA-like peptidoglycan-associated protein
MKKWSTLLIGWFFFSLFTGCATPRGADVPSHTPPQAKRDLIILLPDPDGKVGAITVTTNGGSQVVHKPGYAIEIEDINKAPIAPKPVNEKEINEVFGSALSAQPDPSNRFLLFILYFEHDTTKLTHESKGLFQEILKNIKNRKSTEVYVVGHTDLVGTEAYNMELSSKRARYVRDMLASSGIKQGALFVSYYGKSRPLVPTQNDVPEPRNRRVEVLVR